MIVERNCIIYSTIDFNIQVNVDEEEEVLGYGSGKTIQLRPHWLLPPCGHGHLASIKTLNINEWRENMENDFSSSVMTSEHKNAKQHMTKIGWWCQHRVSSALVFL